MSTMNIPTDQDLEPLFAAAEVYGKASVKSSDLYRALHQTGKDKSSAYATAQRQKKRLLRKLMKVWGAINSRFPGLSLPYVPPFVGFTGDMKPYREKALNEWLPEYVRKLWAKDHQAEIDTLRTILRALPSTESYQLQPGDLVFPITNTGLYRVTRLTPKKHWVYAINMLTPDAPPACIGEPPYKVVSQEVADRLLALKTSEQAALAAWRESRENTCKKDQAA